MPPDNPIVSLLKKLAVEEAKHHKTLNDEFQQTFDFIENFYKQGEKIFSSGHPITYPKTPSTLRKTKRRTELSEENKENKKNKYNTQENETDAKKISTTVKSSKNEAGANPEVDESDPPVRRTRRFTRLQSKRLEESPLTPQAEPIFKKPVGRTKTEVLKKVKEYEEKIISPVINVSPERDPRKSDKIFVSTLSPVKLVDKKLTMTPYVLCSPVVCKPELPAVSKTIRRNSSVNKSLENSKKKKKSILVTYFTKGHRRPSSARSSVYMANLRKSVAESAKEEEEKDNESSDETSEDDKVDVKEKEIQTSLMKVTKRRKSPKTPTPPKYKRVRKVMSNTRSTQKIRSQSRNPDSSCSRPAMPSSASKRFVGTPVSVSRPRMNSSGRFVSPKVLEARIIRQKQEALEKKEEKCRITMKTRGERNKQRADEIGRLRAKRLQQVLDKRKRQEEEKKMEALVKIAAKEKPRERSRVTPSKSSNRLQEKASKAEERRSKEEELRKIKLHEKEEEQIRYLEQRKLKKDMELLKQQERLAEQRKIQLEKQEMKEKEEKRRLELQKQRSVEEEEKKKKELEHQKMKELQRQAAEIAKQRERERVAREKLELERLQERERIAREKVEQSEQAKKEKQYNPASLLKATLNSTFTQSKSFDPDWKKIYDMTPEAVKQPIPLKDPDNYDITDLNSGDSTDDDTHPRKHIPKWAQHYKVKLAVIRQLQDPNFESFFPRIEPPELGFIFNKDRSRYERRGSSANWSSPFRENP
uniref:Inner centromere protein ARK-binding domain-containing protein n=1 Tax=Strigamia maritima TaxID=126957 RepID=T1JIY7_STRMM